MMTLPKWTHRAVSMVIDSYGQLDFTETKSDKRTCVILKATTKGEIHPVLHDEEKIISVLVISAHIRSAQNCPLPMQMNSRCKQSHRHRDGRKMTSIVRELAATEVHLNRGVTKGLITRPSHSQSSLRCMHRHIIVHSSRLS